jgi:hypothetical protein
VRGKDSEGLGCGFRVFRVFHGVAPVRTRVDVQQCLDVHRCLDVDGGANVGRDELDVRPDANDLDVGWPGQLRYGRDTIERLRRVQ